MMSPSARPPSAEEARVVVRVPPPPGAVNMPPQMNGTPMYGTVQPVQMYTPPPGTQAAFDPGMQHAPTMMALPGQQLGAPAATQEEKKKLSPIPIVAVVLAAGVCGGVFLFGSKESPFPEPREASSAAVATSAPQAEPVPPPPTVATNQLPPVPQVIANTEPPPKPFDSAAAKAALEAIAPKLATCKLSKAKACKVKVTFAPDGTVKSASAVAPCSNTSGPGKCVVAGVKKTTIAPFTGNAGTVTVSYPPPPARKK